MSSVTLVAAAAEPLKVPPTPVPGFLFTGTLCAIFLVWGAVIGLSAYRARNDRERLHGGAWGVTGRWQPPVRQLPRQVAPQSPLPSQGVPPAGPVPPGYPAPSYAAQNYPAQNYAAQNLPPQNAPQRTPPPPTRS